MDGFVKMTRELVEVALIVVSLQKEIILSIIPTEFGKAVGYAWKGVVGIANPMGYMMAAVYYFGLDFGYGEKICEYLGYGYYITAALHSIVDFAPKEKEEDIGNNSSEAAKQEAANEAMKKSGE